MSPLRIGWGNPGEPPEKGREEPTMDQPSVTLCFAEEEDALSLAACLEQLIRTLNLDSGEAC